MILEMKYKCGCVMTRERENKPFVEKSTCAEHYTQRTHAGRADREYAERIDAQLSSAARTGRDEFAPHAYQEERGNPFCKVCGCTEQYGKHLSKSDIAALAAKELGLPHTDMPLPPIDSLLMGKKVPELAKDWPIHTLCEPGSLLAYVVQPDEPNGMLAKKQAPNDPPVPTRKVFVPVQMDEMPGKPHVMREVEIPDENADVGPQAPGYNTFEVGRASFYACEGGQECAEGRDHPGRYFICHTGLDDNIAEVFAWNGRSAEQNAGDIARALNNQCTREFEANGGPKSGTMVHASTEDIMDPVEAVPIPRSARHAEMMQKVGYSWLETHAPERLTKAMQDNIKLSVEARMNNPKFGPPQDDRECLAVRDHEWLAVRVVHERDGEWRKALYCTLTECDQRWGTKLLQSVEVGSAGPSVIALTALMLAAWQAGRDDCIKRLTEKMVEITRVK